MLSTSTETVLLHHGKELQNVPRQNAAVPRSTPKQQCRKVPKQTAGVFQSRIVALFLSNSAVMFPVRSVLMFPGRNVRWWCPDRPVEVFLNSSAALVPKQNCRSVPKENCKMFLAELPQCPWAGLPECSTYSSARMFHDRSVQMCQDSNVKNVPESRFVKCSPQTVPNVQGWSARMFLSSNAVIPEQVCKIYQSSPAEVLPKQQCSNVPRQECSNVPRQECNQVCEDISGAQGLQLRWMEIVFWT